MQTELTVQELGAWKHNPTTREIMKQLNLMVREQVENAIYQYVEGDPHMTHEKLTWVRGFLHGLQCLLNIEQVLQFNEDEDKKE